MKKILTSVILASGMVLCASSAKAANDYNLTPEIASAYFEVVDGIAQKHNNYLLKAGNEMDGDGFDANFWDARLVDFNGDKVPELFFIYDSNEYVNHFKIEDSITPTNQYQVWGWNGSNAYQIACENIKSIADTGVIDVTLLGLLNEDGRTYIPFMTHAGDVDGLKIIEFYTLINGVWKSAPEKTLYGEASINEYGDFITLNPTIGGKSVSQTQFNNRWLDVKEKTLDIWRDKWEDNGYYTYVYQKFIDFANEVNLPIELTSNVETVLVDGSSVQIQAYNVGNTNYMRLRDIAAIMKNTQKPFDVQWLFNQIIVIKDTLYSGDKNNAIYQSGVATKTIGRIFYMTSDEYLESLAYDEIMSEWFVESRALKINNENYVKLRDIAKCINFGVDWDSNTKTVIIDSSKNYSA